jgi:predicted phage tail protein
MINLFGKLARRFEKKYNTSPRDIKIKVNSVQELMRAMNANFKGFSSLIDRAMSYKISRCLFIDDSKTVSEQEIGMSFSNTDWSIMPCASGCGGIGKFLVGAALITTAFLLPATAPAMLSSFLGSMGLSLVLGGLAQLLSPMPQMEDYTQSEKPEEKPSYLFAGPKNSVEPGLTIPTAYGLTYCGTITVSGGLELTDVDL